MPEFADLVEGVRHAVIRRSRSLKHMFPAFGVEDIAHDAAPPIRGVQLRAQARRSVRGPVLRLQAWEDGWVWFDARGAAPGGGWMWEWTVDGRVNTARSAADLIEAFAQSRLHLGDASDVASLSKLWSRLLVDEPGERVKVRASA